MFVCFQNSFANNFESFDCFNNSSEVNCTIFGPAAAAAIDNRPFTFAVCMTDCGPNKAGLKFKIACGRNDAKVDIDVAKGGGVLNTPFKKALEPFGVVNEFKKFKSIK